MRATISTGGAAKCVRVPPTDTDTKSRATVAYLNFSPGLCLKKWFTSSMAQMVIAAGSVMKEPSSGPTHSIAHHHALIVPPPIFANMRMKHEAKWTTGFVEAIAIIATTKTGSAYLSPT